jgi:hypothetical protein
MHDVGITASLSLSLPDTELLIDTPHWRALIKAEIQNSKSKLDEMAKKQTRQCENQAKRKQAREYLRDKKDPSKFCGNMHSSQAPKELVQGMPVGILRINQGPTETTDELIKRIQEEVPSAEVQRAEDEVALLILAIPEAKASEGAALMMKAQQMWRWRTALRTPQRLMEVLRILCLQRSQSNPEESTLRQMAQDAVDILWEEQEGHRHAMTIGNAGGQHRGECSWWAQGPRCLEQIQEWKQWVQQCHVSSDSEVSECVTFADGILSVRVEGGQQLLKMAMDNGNFLETITDEPSKAEPRVQVEPPQHAEEKPEDRSQMACAFTECRIWHGPPGALEVVYVQVKRLLDWEALVLITQNSGRGSINGNIVGEQEVQTNEHAQTPKGTPRRTDSVGHCKAQ